MSSPSPLIWFLLLDSATGQPFKNTTVSSIIRFSADVADFRDAVKIKNSNKLSSFDAADLLVYKNKAAFDKRNASVDEEKEKPLKSSCLLGDLGASKKEALVVVIPSLIMPSQPQDSSFPLCQIPFYSNLCKATERDGWISFGKEIPSTTLKKLYIRESYRTIASSMIKKAIITGTPGTGKSLFLIYLLWTLVKSGKRVLFVYHPFTIYYDGQGGVFELTSLPPVPDHSFWASDLWCLFDDKCKQEFHFGKFPLDRFTFILSTPPRRELVNDFKKPPRPMVFYMPLWTELELETISPCFSAVTDWHYRFKILGGIPRYVLEDSKHEPTKLLEAACMQCDLNDCFKIIDLSSTITVKSKVVHSLVHMTSIHPFTESSVQFASQAALDIIVKYKGIEAKRIMPVLLDSCEWNPLSAALCGNIFEPHAIELLEKGGTFKCRELVRGNMKVKPAEMTLDIPSSIKTVVDKVKMNQTPNQLYVVKTTNHSAFDAWIPGIGAFQMAVGKDHEIKEDAGDDLAMLGQGANKLYWILPPSFYHSFTKKSPQYIEEYAIRIPYPSVGN